MDQWFFITGGGGGLAGFWLCNDKIYLISLPSSPPPPKLGSAIFLWSLEVNGSQFP